MTTKVSISTAVFLVIVALTNAEPKSSDSVRRSTYSSYSDSRDSYSRDNDGYRSPRYESSGPSDENSEEYNQPASGAAPKSKKTVILAIPVKLALQNQQANQDRQYDQQDNQGYGNRAPSYEGNDGEDTRDEEVVTEAPRKLKSKRKSYRNRDSTNDDGNNSGRWRESNSNYGGGGADNYHPDSSLNTNPSNNHNNYQPNNQHQQQQQYYAPTTTTNYQSTNNQYQHQQQQQIMPQVQSHFPPPPSSSPPPPPPPLPAVNFQGYGQQPQQPPFANYNQAINNNNNYNNGQYVNPNINNHLQLTATGSYSSASINGQSSNSNNNLRPAFVPLSPLSSGNVYANNGQQQQQQAVTYVNSVPASNSQYNNNGNSYQQPAIQYVPAGQQPQQQIIYQPVAVQTPTQGSSNGGNNNYNQNGNSNYNSPSMSNNYNNNVPQGYQEVTATPTKSSRGNSGHQADQVTSNEEEAYQDQDSPRPYTGAAQTYENSKRPSYSDSSRSKNTESAYDQEPTYESDSGAEEAAAYRPSKSKKSSLSSQLSMAGYEEIPASELYGSSRGSSLSGSSSLYKGLSDGDEYNLESLSAAMGGSSSSSPYAGMGIEGSKLSSVYPEGSEMSPFSEYESAFGGSDVSGLSSSAYGSLAASSLSSSLASSSSGSPSAASLYASSSSPFSGSASSSSPDLSMLFASSGMKMPRGASFSPASFASSSPFPSHPSSHFGLRPSPPSFRPYPSASSMYPTHSPYSYGRPSMRRPSPHYGMAPSNYYKSYAPYPPSYGSSYAASSQSKSYLPPSSPPSTSKYGSGYSSGSPLKIAGMAVTKGGKGAFRIGNLEFGRSSFFPSIKIRSPGSRS